MENKKSFSAHARKTLLWGLPILLVIWFIINGSGNYFISIFFVLPLIITLWLVVAFSMLKRGEIEYGRYLGKFPKFKIRIDNFIPSLLEAGVFIGYIGLGFIGAILAILGFYLYYSAVYDPGEWEIVFFIAPIPALVAGPVYGVIVGGTSRKWWTAFLGGIVGGVVGFHSLFADETAAWLGIVIGALVGFVFGKRKRVWATLLGGIIGFAIAIICGFVFDW